MVTKIYFLCYYSEPSSRFEIFFDVLDADCSGTIDLNEFSLVNRL